MSAEIEAGSFWVRVSTGAKVRALPLSDGSLYAENLDTGRSRWWRSESFTAHHRPAETPADSAEPSR